MRPTAQLPAPRQDCVTGRERRWVFGFAAVVLLATTLPYVLGFAVQGEEWRFSGFVFGVEDGNSYIAKMLSGAAGAWLFRTPYTAYPQQGALIFLPYILLGKLAAPPGLHEQLVALYHLFRIAAGILAILATYDFLAFFLENVVIRRLGLALATLGGGLGWLLLLLGQEGWLGSLPLEFYSPETFGFLSLYGIPHLALARALLLWGLVAFLRRISSEGDDFRGSEYRKIFSNAAKIGCIWLLTGLAQPLTGMVVGAVIGIYLLAVAGWQAGRSLRGKHADWPALRHGVRLAILAGLVPAPLVIYNLMVFNLDPFLETWTAQSTIPSPHPLHYVLGYGLVLPLAWPGGRRLFKFAPWRGWLLVAWTLALPILAYAPFSLQRRLPEGTWVALAVLAMAGVEGWIAREPRKPPQARLRFAATLLGVLLFSPAFLSTLLLFAGGLMAALNPARQVFSPAAEVSAFETIRGAAEPGAVVLAAYPTGNALPAWAPVRVVIGHGPESANLAGLLPKVAGFYTPGTADSARLELIRQVDVRYVFWGPAERALGGWDPTSASYLDLLHQSGDYAVYKVIVDP